MKALISGAGGQDGQYLSQHLLRLGYQVFGGYRRSSHGVGLPKGVEPVPLELLEYESIKRAIERVKPDEIYNLGAQTHVGESFGCPLYTHDVNAQGVLRLLELVRSTQIALYQASTSEMFGGGTNLDEQSPLRPRSPYACAKVSAHHLCGVYRRAYGVRVSCGILFNHESALRSKEFVTRKITWHLSRDLPFTLGNVSARRDWGHAADYVEAMHLMLQHEPDDFVIATGESHSVADFLKEASRYVPWKPQVEYSSSNERAWDVNELSGNAEKAHKILGWKPKYDFQSLVAEMMKADSVLESRLIA